MTTTQKYVIGALVAYLIWRSGILNSFFGGVFGGVGGLSPGAAPSSTPPTPATPPSAGKPGTPALPAQTADVKVSAGWADSANGDVFAADVNFDTQGPVLYEQLIRPAGRVRPYQDVPPLYWQLAFALLSWDTTNDGVGARQDAASQRYQQFLATKAEQESGILADKIIGSVVSIVLSAVGAAPIGALLQAVIQIQVNDLQDAITAETQGAGLLSRIRQQADPKQLPPFIAAVLSPGFDVDDRLVKTFDGTGVVVESLFQSRYVSGGTSHAESDFPWHAADGTAYWFPSKLFLQTQFGFLLPWLGSKLQGATGDDTVEIRARVFRAVETFRAMAYPSAPGTIANAYWYTNKYLGPILGTCLPPTSEDLRYVDSATGIVYNFDGTHATGDVGGHTTVGYGSLNAPGAGNTVGVGSIDVNQGYTPDPTDPNASSGPGESFNDNPAPPPTTVALGSLAVGAPPPLSLGGLGWLLGGH